MIFWSHEYLRARQIVITVWTHTHTVLYSSSQSNVKLSSRFFLFLFHPGIPTPLIIIKPPMLTGKTRTVWRFETPALSSAMKLCKFSFFSFQPVDCGPQSEPIWTGTNAHHSNDEMAVLQFATNEKCCIKHFTHCSMESEIFIAVLYSSPPCCIKNENVCGSLNNQLGWWGVPVWYYLMEVLLFICIWIIKQCKNPFKTPKPLIHRSSWQSISMPWLTIHRLFPKWWRVSTNNCFNINSMPPRIFYHPPHIQWRPSSIARCRMHLRTRFGISSRSSHASTSHSTASQSWISQRCRPFHYGYSH